MKKTARLTLALGGVAGLALSAGLALAQQDPSTDDPNKSGSSQGSDDTTKSGKSKPGTPKEQYPTSTRNRPERAGSAGAQTITPLSDATVLSMLHTANQDEIQAAKLASDQSDSKQVKQFADMIVKDHQKLDASVTKLGDKKSFTLTSVTPFAARQMQLGGSGSSGSSGSSSDMGTDTGKRDTGGGKMGSPSGGSSGSMGSSGGSGSMGSSGSSGSMGSSGSSGSMGSSGSSGSGGYGSNTGGSGSSGNTGSTGSSGTGSSGTGGSGTGGSGTGGSGSSGSMGSSGSSGSSDSYGASPEGASADKLKGLKGAAFDQAFLTQMSQDHAQLLEVLRAERSHASSHDREVTGLIRDSIPVIERHHQRALNILKNIPSA